MLALSSMGGNFTDAVARIVTLHDGLGINPGIPRAQQSSGWHSYDTAPTARLERGKCASRLAKIGFDHHHRSLEGPECLAIDTPQVAPQRCDRQRQRCHHGGSALQLLQDIITKEATAKKVQAGGTSRRAGLYGMIYREFITLRNCEKFRSCRSR